VLAADGAGVEIVSRDRGAACRIDPQGRLDANVGPDLDFIVRLTRHCLFGMEPGASAWPTKGVRVITECRAPAGSGLGGSSALGVALAAALTRFTGGDSDPKRILQVTRAVETQVLAIPTGEQDYHPALHGGLLGLHYGFEGTRIERLDVDPVALRRRTVLIFTGVSRNSGLSNWDMFKRHLDGEASVRGALQAIADAAQAFRASLLRGRWDEAGLAMAAEWEARRRLSPTVSSEALDQLIRTGLTAGAIAGKVCGAGGGGCMVFWVPDGASGTVERALAGAGEGVLDFDYAPHGLQVTES